MWFLIGLGLGMSAVGYRHTHTQPEPLFHHAHIDTYNWYLFSLSHDWVFWMFGICLAVVLIFYVCHDINEGFMEGKYAISNPLSWMVVCFAGLLGVFSGTLLLALHSWKAFLFYLFVWGLVWCWDGWIMHIYTSRKANPKTNFDDWR